MPLDEREQRILAEIERQLLEDDPKFAQQVGASTLRAHLGRRLRLLALGAVVGFVLVFVGLLQNFIAVGALGFLVMVLSIFEFLRTVRRRAAAERRGGAPPAARSATKKDRGSSKGSVEARWAKLNERWRQRWEERGGSPPSS